MSAKAALARLANRLLRPFGAELASSAELVWLREAWMRRPRETGAPLAPPPLPEGVRLRLRPDAPRLLELRRRYAAVRHPGAARSVWTAEHVASGVDLERFRADGAFLWQRGGDLREVNYALSAAHVRSVVGGLLDRLDEDGLFGAVTYDVDGLMVSRDRLDSALELGFLEETVGLEGRGATVLDVGAGYGRLAWAMARAFPGTTTLCVDAVAEGTFLSEFYLGFRGAGAAARVVPLDEVEESLSRERILLATNVHSFSEAPLESIRWWIGLLARLEVRFLLVVPDEEIGDGLRSLERDGATLSFEGVLEENGYAPLLRRPKYVSPSVQRNGLSPTTYHLFERRG